MPEIGETKVGKEIGLASPNKHMWVACEVCGKERWVLLRHGKPKARICVNCSNSSDSRISLLKSLKGVHSNRWNGGRVKGRGYIYIRVYPNDFFFPMADHRSYVPEHRLLMAKHLNRCLLTWEIVHHKNGIKDDNRLENLELLSTSKQHLPDVLTKARIKQLVNENKRLKIKIKKLEEQLKT